MLHYSNTMPRGGHVEGSNENVLMLSHRYSTISLLYSREWAVEARGPGAWSL